MKSFMALLIPKETGQVNHPTISQHTLNGRGQHQTG
ncbi:hypothetical protein TH47_17810 [Thalassospira sp. MCCC 1A02803]|nr:hypothetical protein TH47_17810 [Thalassospira sp. MCCC 1A02803]